MTAQATSKRDAFEVIYQNLTRLQGSYRQMTLQCLEQLYHFPPTENEVTVKFKNNLERNIQIAEDAVLRLEKIKYHSSIAILTEGSNINEKELSTTITEIDLLMEMAKIEANGEDKEFATWANDKIEHLDNTKNVLLQVLTHKIDAQVKIGKALYQ